MPPAKRILMVAALEHKPLKMFLDQTVKLGKGFIRLGHDVRYFSYTESLARLNPFKSRKLGTLFYKNKVDDFLATQIKNYQPDIIYLSFPRVLDAATIEKMRYAAPKVVFVGFDGDLWPNLHPGRIEAAKKLDVLMVTNAGTDLKSYQSAGVSNCVFMPNICDPDTDHRYDVEDKWKKNILWTGLIAHDVKRYPGEKMRYEIISRLAKMPNCSVYGCCGRPKIGGIEYLYAISGAKIGLSINADNTMHLYHSDRLTHYLACGTLVLAKRIPDTDLLFKDGIHLRYFDSLDEFFELVDWYLKHEDDSKRIADAGMKWMHEQFNCVKIAGYILDLIEKGKYSAPWNQI